MQYNTNKYTKNEKIQNVCGTKAESGDCLCVFFIYIFFLTTVWLGGGVLALNALQDTGLSGQDSWNGAECGNKR